MAAKKLDPEQALIKALGHPVRKELLKLCLEADEPKTPKGLALATHQGKGSFQKHLSNVSYHRPHPRRIRGAGDRRRRTPARIGRLLLPADRAGA